MLAIVLLEEAGGSAILACMPNTLQNQRFWREAWWIHNGNAGSEKQAKAALVCPSTRERLSCILITQIPEKND